MKARAKQTTPVRLYLLGRFCLEQNGQRLRLPTRKVESLLAYLVLHPGTHTREKLAALFWGDFSDAQARASLRNALPALRKHLGQDSLLAERYTIQLNPALNLWVDALEFQRQATDFMAVAQPQIDAFDPTLYQGELLTDFYDEWLIPQREAWHRLYLEASLQLIHQKRSQGLYTAAVALAEQLLAVEPTYEATHRAVMACYLTLGNYAAVQQQYETCRRLLWNELGVEPEPETILLWRQSQKEAAQHRPIPAEILGNLPIPFTSFIGRAKETAALIHQLTTARLLVLTGPGGSGKTRLAIQVARQLAHTYDDGVWWVELAALAEPAFVPQAVRRSLGLAEPPAISTEEMLINHLRSRHVLLVLDNCEHLLLACAHLAQQLLSHCPQLTILATSREILGLTGETVYAIPPLSPPLTDEPETARHSDAVRLFVERAAAVQFTFQLNDNNAATIAQLCRQLDGLPLALELAAARCKLLSPAAILNRLHDRFTLLTSGNRTALPRQQTLRAAVDWSYDLLDEPEKKILQQLAVFAGTFPLEGAAAVCTPTLGNEATLIDLLTHLVDKSLLMAEPTATGEMRYRLLETIRQYAQEKLALAGEASITRQRHLTWVCQLAETAEEKLLGAEQIRWLKQLNAEYDNISSALYWAAESDRTAVATGLRLGGSLWRYWDGRGYLAEAQEMLARLLARPESLESEAAVGRAKALYSLGIVTHLQGEDAAATNLFMESLAIWQRVGQAGALGAARAAHFIAFMALRRADYPTAHIWYTQCYSRYQQLQDAWGLSEAQSQMGTLALREGHITTARALQEEALARKQALGDLRGIRFSVWALGNIARLQADYVIARSCYAQALQTAQQSEDKWSLPYCIEAFGYLALAEEQPQRAAVIFAAAAALRAATSAPLPPVWQADYSRALTNMENSLDAVTFATAWHTGQTMSLNDAIRYTLDEKSA